ncbi:MAG TPA: ATP-binding protein [Burkholderiaceae bacterium]|nr:ATP-binding protein [Burkholderiaceae bacterium]
MSIWPQSLARQTTLVLIAGMALVVVAGVAVASLTLIRPAGSDGTEDLVGRIGTLVAVSQQAPPPARPAIHAAAAQTGLSVAPLPADADEIFPDWWTQGLQRQLVRELQPLGATVLALGHTRSGATAGAAHLGAPHGPILARVALSDGTRLEIVTQGGWSALHALAQIVPTLVVVGLGLTALAVWVGRRITRPLGLFAAAATRLGTDLTAPPLPARGPSELRAAATAFNRMQERVRRLIDDRLLMLAAVSHDLRTPITRLRLRAEFIDEDVQREKMLKDLDEMEAMIAAALAFAREETVVEPRGPVDLRRVLDEIAAELTESGGAVMVAGAARTQINGRATALKRALRNLVENAVKYGGRAAVRLHARPGEFIVTIEDDGPGIPESELEKVFRPFYRVEPSRSRETGGTGLGLAVARSVVRSHGGDIVLANRHEGGLIQTIVLPAT